MRPPSSRAPRRTARAGAAPTAAPARARDPTGADPPATTALRRRDQLALRIAERQRHLRGVRSAFGRQRGEPPLHRLRQRPGARQRALVEHGQREPRIALLFLPRALPRCSAPASRACALRRRSAGRGRCGRGGRCRCRRRRASGGTRAAATRLADPIDRSADRAQRVERVAIAAVRRRAQQQDVGRARRERVHRGSPIGIARARVRLVDDDEIPAAGRSGGEDLRALDVVDRRDRGGQRASTG